MEEKKLNEQSEAKGEDMNEEALQALAGGGDGATWGLIEKASKADRERNHQPQRGVPYRP